MTDAAEVFAEHRGLLFTVAYEMLGSAADAEDVVQDSWLRWSARLDKHSLTDEVRDPLAYLVRVVTRQSLNRLRTLQRQRETYVGTWLPEPLVTTADVAEDVELADSVSFAMLVVLETLSPLERAVFVLREVFGFGYDEIAAATEKEPAAVRQLASRARKHVEARRPRVEVPQNSQEIVAQFFLAASTGEVEPLIGLLAPEVVLHTDGGGFKKAALRPIHGATKVARFLAAVVPTDSKVDVSWGTVNGAAALFLYLDDELDAVGTVVAENGLVKEIYLVRNPEKLTGVEVIREVRR
ncbi:RNA polymerase sigma-70 factor (TIGR02957 family) [Marmoricola sp. OAE513]|uniref:RNA polymerase sigma-70 factor n=1 Tax=Marmoricola sp. OAE513 TaxID=2817894 RepID=UPI001AE78583